MTRKEAQRLGLPRYLGDPCKLGHDGWRFKTGHCITCCAQKRDDPFKRASAAQRARSWYAENKEQAARTAKRYRETHPGYELASKRKWKTENQPAVRAATAHRRALRVSATPNWLTKEHREQIRHIYRLCPEGHEVDHIIPIASAFVCGLHVPWNLQPLTKEANRKKSNKVFQRLALAFISPSVHPDENPQQLENEEFHQETA